MTQRNEHEKSRMLDIPVRLIQMIHDRPRRILDPEAMERMKSSLATAGQLQPIGVRRHGNAWTLIFGYLRLHAALQLGWKTIRAVEYPEMENQDLLDLALWANQNLHHTAPALDEMANCISKMVDAGMSDSVIALALGKSVDWVIGMRDIARDPMARRLIEIGRLMTVDDWLAFKNFAPNHRLSMLKGNLPVKRIEQPEITERIMVATQPTTKRKDTHTQDLWPDLLAASSIGHNVVARKP